MTKGDFEVGEVYRVDPEHKEIEYASNEGSALDQQVWQATFDGERKQLTTGAGNHDADFAPTGRRFTDKYSSRMEPPVLRALCQSDPSVRRSGRRMRLIHMVCAARSSWR